MTFNLFNCDFIDIKKSLLNLDIWEEKLIKTNKNWLILTKSISNS